MTNITKIDLIWKCKGLAKYGRSGAERRAKISKQLAVGCDECDWWHLLPRRIIMRRIGCYE